MKELRIWEVKPLTQQVRQLSGWAVTLLGPAFKAEIPYRQSSGKGEQTSPWPTAGAESQGPRIHPLSHWREDSKERAAGLISVALGTFIKSTAGLRSFDSGWAVWEIPAELGTYSDQKLKTDHHLSGLWFGRSLNDFILSGEPGSFLNPTHLAGIFLFFGLQCFLASKEWRTICKIPLSSGSQNQ